MRAGVRTIFLDAILGANLRRGKIKGAKGPWWGWFGVPLHQQGFYQGSDDISFNVPETRLPRRV